jgi:hypothetical protein
LSCRPWSLSEETAAKAPLPAELSTEPTALVATSLDALVEYGRAVVAREADGIVCGSGTGTDAAAAVTLDAGGVAGGVDIAGTGVGAGAADGVGMA